MSRAGVKAFDGGVSAAQLSRAVATLLALICATESTARTRTVATTVDLTITGRASVVDGDTIEIHGQKNPSARH
jgi:endonuclease YncB( thermonuclease family)